MPPEDRIDELYVKVYGQVLDYLCKSHSDDLWDIQHEKSAM